MNCTEAREAILVAEPHELSDADGTPLSEHLRRCERCAAMVHSLALDLAGLSRSVPIRSVRRVRAIAALTLIPVAAAIVGILAVRPGPAPRPIAPAPPVNVRTANVVSVEVAPGQQATVIKTKDPKVTVVWLTPGGGL